MKVLFIDVEKRNIREENINNEKIKGVLDLGIYLHIDVYKSWNYDIYHPNNVVVIGCGNFKYGGNQRGSIIFRSPLHGGLHSSTVGDLGEYIKMTGYNAIVIEGKGEYDTFIIINKNNVYFINYEIKEDIFDAIKDLEEKLRNYYNNSPYRILIVGSASKNTKYGAIMFPRLDKKYIVSAGGRGGGGSVLYNAHRVVGISLGGEKINVEQYDIKKVFESTKKYRESGTFKGNYEIEGNILPYFNFQTIYLNKEERDKLYKELIINKLLRDYNFKSDTCGEKCVAACKKIEKNIKIDYEPANGLGPFIGIFNRDYVEELIELADKFGFDSIYLGYVLGMIIEACYKGLINLKDYGIDIKPKFDMNDNSNINYNFAKTIIEKIAKGEIKILGENIRKIAKNFNIQDLGYYIPYGEEYDMTPNFYWTLGLILPMIMPGKYFSDYKFVGIEPEEYAKICFERTLYEYLHDNYGVCRFHRIWVETYLIKEEDKENAKYWIKRLYEYRKLSKSEPIYWESKRVEDSAKRLLEEFSMNIDTREYWERWYKKYLELLG